MTTKTIKIGDLTLRQLKEILNTHCSWPCNECKVKHKADYVVCQLCLEYDLAFDWTDNMLNQEIEVEYDDKDN